MKNNRQISLVKGNHSFVFKYTCGQEEDLVNILLDKANDNKTQFDWLDAAVLSYKLGRRLEEETVSKSFYTCSEVMTCLKCTEEKLNEIVHVGKLSEFRDGDKTNYKVIDVDNLSSLLKGNLGVELLYDIGDEVSNAKVQLEDSGNFINKYVKRMPIAIILGIIVAVESVILIFK